MIRVNIYSGKVKSLTHQSDSIDYEIKGKKIYYLDLDSEKVKKMDLNGKHKKRTKVKIRMKKEKSNADGYYIKKSGSEEKKTFYYLRTPKGRFYFAKKTW